MAYEQILNGILLTVIPSMTFISGAVVITYFHSPLHSLLMTMACLLFLFVNLKLVRGVVVAKSTQLTKMGLQVSKEFDDLVVGRDHINLSNQHWQEINRFKSFLSELYFAASDFATSMLKLGILQNSVMLMIFLIICSTSYRENVSTDPAKDLIQSISIFLLLSGYLR